MKRRAFLKGADPEEMYQKECDVRGQMVDRCQLYMYRMAVYYASSKNPDPKKLKWWILERLILTIIGSIS